MTNQEKPDINEKPEKQTAVSPLVFVLVTISSVFIILVLLNNAINTPLVRSFDDAAKRSKNAACETKASVENFPPEDCYK